MCVLGVRLLAFPDAGGTLLLREDKRALFVDSPSVVLQPRFRSNLLFASRKIHHSDGPRHVGWDGRSEIVAQSS